MFSYVQETLKTFYSKRNLKVRVYGKRDASPVQWVGGSCVQRVISMALKYLRWSFKIVLADPMIPIEVFLVINASCGKYLLIVELRALTIIRVEVKGLKMPLRVISKLLVRLMVLLLRDFTINRTNRTFSYSTRYISWVNPQC